MELCSLGVLALVIACTVLLAVFVIPSVFQLYRWQLQHDESVGIKIMLEDGGIMPVKAHEDDACYDLYLPRETLLRYGRQQIPLGFRIQLPTGYCAYIRSRSGNMSKGMENIDGVRFDAEVKTGIVDAGYRGIVGCIVQCNVMAHSEAPLTKLAYGYKIAQMAILPVPETELMLVCKLDESERGAGGFGSTGTV